MYGKAIAEGGILLRAGRHNNADDRNESKALKWTLILASAAIGLIVEYLIPGWGRPVLLTLLIFGSLVGFCQPWWGRAFWLVAIGTFGVHVVVAFRFRTTINELSLPALFLWAVAEVIIIATVLALVFPDKKQDGTTLS